MANNFKEKDQVLYIIQNAEFENGISYSQIHDAYFEKEGIRLGDLQLKPIIEQLRADNFILLASLIDGVEYFKANPNAKLFLANGGYQAKLLSENEILQKDLKIKELQLELEQTNKRIVEFENKKDYKYVYISIIALLTIALLFTLNMVHKNSSLAVPLGDSIHADSTNIDHQYEPVKVSSDTKADQNAATTYDSIQVHGDTIR